MTNSSFASSRVLLFGLSFLLIALASGCGSATHVSDTISPNGTIYLDAGQVQTFTAQVNNDPSSSGVTFQLIGAGALVMSDAFHAVYTAPANATTAVTASVVATPVANPSAGAAAVIFLAAAPAITTTTLPATTAGSTYSQQIASTGGTTPNTFALASGSLPPGLTLSATGLISGTTTGPGTYTFTVSLTDSATTPVTVKATYTLVVNPAALTITTGALPTGVVTKLYSAAVTSTGGTGADTYTLYSGNLPGGLTLSTSGAITGTPTAAGNFVFTVQVTDSGTPTPQVVRKTLSITVYGLLTVTTTSLPNGALHNAYTATLQATGGNNSYSWTLLSGSLPAGLSLSPAGVISGTPSATGTSTFTVQVADTSSPQQTATASLTINIVLSTLAITTTTLPQVTVNSNYSQQLTYSGGNPPVTWALAAGSNPLPTGLQLSSAGLISGVPTVVGNYSFTVQATDSTPASVTQALSINVVPLSTLSVTTTTLPAGNIDTPYTASLAATGGATPYTWTISSGTLPVGLTLSTVGVISGTPYVTGSTTFTVKVTDSQGTPATATRSETITIGTTLPTGANNSNLLGNYAFLINGFKTGNTAGAVSGFGTVGSLAFSGAGTITGTEDTNTPTGAQQAVAVTGTYTVGSDNRGFMVLTAGGQSIVYTIAVANVQLGIAQSIAIAEFDDSTGTGATASGYAKAQTASAFVAATFNGSFSFGLQGESVCSTCSTPAPAYGPVVEAGFFTGNGTATITTGTEDAAAYGTNYASVTIAGTFTPPSATTGRGTVVLTPSAAIFSAPPVNYTYVIVSANELLLLSQDSHASFALLYGDAVLQQSAPYAAASLTGRSIGYESQANGGDGHTTLPVSLNAILYNLSVTGSGTASLIQDANRAGVFTTGTTAATYLVATNGRTAITTGSTANQVVYLDGTGAGFGIDVAPTTGYPGLLQYELQLPAGNVPFLFGTFAQSTILTPVAATTATGLAVYRLNSGGVNGLVTGQLTLTTDSDSPAGTVRFAQTTSETSGEDVTGRVVISAAGAQVGITDVITTQRAVSIPTTAGTTPTVLLNQK